MNHEADLTFLGVQKRDMDTVLKSVITLLFNRILRGGSEETLELERGKTSGQVGSILPRD